MGSIVWLVLVGSGFSPAEAWTPTADVVVGAGHEDDLVLFDDLDTRIIPGGMFGELRAVVLATSPRGDRGHLRIGAHGTWQRFLKSDGRRLASGGLFTEIRQPFHDRWHVVIGARGSGYDDDSRPDVRRLEAGGHGAVGLSGHRWTLEAGAAFDGVRLPEYSLFTADGSLETLTESAVSVYGSLLLRLGHTAFARIDARSRDGDSVDPFYDATTRILGLTLWLPVGRRGRLTIGAGERDRAYPHRAADADDDRWRHLGLGYEYRLDDSWRVMLDAGVGEYRDPFGHETDSQRVSVAFGWRPWRRKAPPPPPPPHREHEPVLFRCHAPEADVVVLVGEFNTWDPVTDPMTRADDGWWETRRLLPAGCWQYTFLVDGRPVTPADADLLVPDGFGSRNGLIKVQPKPVTSEDVGRLMKQRPEDEPSDGPDEDQE